MEHDTFLKILQKGPFELSLAKCLIHQLASTLAALHRMNVAHCDIKPENIMVAKSFQLKYCDFGFARFADKPQAPPGGTPGYTAPELYESRELDLRKCDVFSLGVVAFIIVVGFPPFQSNGPTSRDAWWSLIANRQWDFFWGRCEQFRQQKFDRAICEVLQGMLEPEPGRRSDLERVLSAVSPGSANEEDVLKEIEKRVKA